MPDPRCDACERATPQPFSVQVDPTAICCRALVCRACYDRYVALTNGPRRYLTLAELKKETKHSRKESEPCI